MPNKMISEDDKLRAFAMYVLACQQYNELRKLERGIAKILGATTSGEYNDFVSDAIYSNDAPSGSMSDFDEALSSADIIVVRRKAKKPRK